MKLGEIGAVSRHPRRELPILSADAIQNVPDLAHWCEISLDDRPSWQASAAGQNEKIVWFGEKLQPRRLNTAGLIVERETFAQGFRQWNLSRIAPESFVALAQNVMQYD